jgi:hypothetical protein
VSDPDAIWKPGYDGPPPVVESLDDSDETRAADAPVTRTRTRGRRTGVGAIAVAAVAVAAIALGAAVVLDPFGSGDDASVDGSSVDDASVDEGPRPVIEPPDPSVFAGAADRRLPDEAAILWSVDLEHDGDHWVEVIRRDLVVAAITDAAESTSIVALEASTGESRWTLRVGALPRDVTVVGVVGDVLVLEQPGVDGTTLVAVEVATGEVRWSSDAVANDGHVALAGTALIARLPQSPAEAVSLLDATTGNDVGAIPSDPSDPSVAGRPAGWSTNGEGVWYVVDDGVVAEYDLRRSVGDARVIARDVDASAPPLVVDDRVAVVDDAGSLAFADGAAGADADPRVAVSAEVPTRVRALTPVSDSAFVVAAPRTISGVVVEDDAAYVTWERRDGVVVQRHPVVGGSLIHVATEGGAANQLVDGLSGETVEHLTMTPGALQALVVTGDGAVVVRSSAMGARLAGIDLAGTERWSIPGPAPVLVGDRIVVRATSSGDGASSSPLRITAYGEPD